MTIKTIAGPFKTRKEADETAMALGTNCSVFSTEQLDCEGYGINIFDYFVEQDDSILSGKLFGYDQKAFMLRQYR